MSGAGRRSQHRKHLTDGVLHNFPEPADGERIAKVVHTRGCNQFDILLATTVAATPSIPQLAILPAKFHKLVWVKRGDYVIVRMATDEVDETERETADKSSGGIRFMIVHILFKEQVKNLKTKQLWPTHDPEFGSEGPSSVPVHDPQEVASGDDDGIVYNDVLDNDDDLFVNTNRPRIIRRKEDDDSESDDDE